MTKIDEPIAIVGLGGRLPGDGDTLPKFWQSLCDGKSAWSKIPSSRFNAEAFWSPSKNQNTSAAQAGHFLTQDVAKFDANFFSFPKKDVQAMDPQHRMMIEVAYEALENAGIPLEKVAGTQTGVFVGHFTSDYKEMIYRDPENAPLYTVSGSSKTSLANRISWMWDLRGPSFSMDTACSSSLVALHLACQSLRTGESDCVLVGGTSLLLNPEMFRYLSNQSFLSPDGKCKSFDESANGYGRGEGFGCLVLKRVNDAVAAGDPVRAVIRGTGSNQDGRTKGLTLPSADAQAALINETYRRAGVGFDDVGYIEAHGTGTQAGDRTEVEALGRTIAAGRNEQNKLLVGSVKSNIGHLEAAAGVASVLKSVYILENGVIPPSINFNKPNPKIHLDENNVQVASKLQPWPKQGTRRISTNSFGYGGTNAHAIIDDAQSFLRGRGVSGSQLASLAKVSPNELTNGHANGNTELQRTAGPRLFVFSAQDKDGLRRVGTQLESYLNSTSPDDDDDAEQALLANLAYTLSERRTFLQWKSYSTASSVEELTAALTAGSTSVAVQSSRPPRLGFVFTGQGAQWPRMGAELMTYDVFSNSVKAADAYFRDECDCPWSALVELQKNKSTSQLHLAEYSQTLCTVLQVALVDLLQSWNIYPSAVAGHSSGEIGAAYAFGALNREDAWKIAYWRGVLSSEMKSNAPDLDGSMMAAGLSPDAAEEWITKVKSGKVVVACVNSPSSVTISGDTKGTDELEGLLKEQSIFARKLQVDTAYHSHHMQTVAQDYYDALADVLPLAGSGSCTMHSSVTGYQIESSQLGAVNWVRNLTSSVQFAAAITDMARPFKAKGTRAETNAVDLLVEVGPHSALRGPALQTLKASGITSIPYESMLTRNENAISTAMTLAGALFARGVPVNIAKVNRDDTRQHPKVLVDLPSYPWNHSQSYWHESRFEKEYLSRSKPKRSLLPAPAPSLVAGEKLWRGALRLSEEPWMSDHKIQGAILYPAAGYVAMAIEAMQDFAAKDDLAISSYLLRDIELVAAAVITEDKDLECVVQLRPHDAKWTSFTITTSPNASSLVKNCSGKIAVEYGSTAEDWAKEVHLKVLTDHFSQAKRSCQRQLKVDDFYADLTSKGLDYGPAFACVSEAYTSDKDLAYAVLTIPEAGTSRILEEEDRPHVVFPGTLDAAFHVAFAAMQGNDSLHAAMVPHYIREVRIDATMAWKPGSRIPGYSSIEKHGHKGLQADIVLMQQDESRPCVEVTGFKCAEVQGVSGDGDATSARSITSKLSWLPEITLMKGSQLTEYLGAFSGADVLTQMVLLLHHSNPAISVLEVASARPTLLSAQLQSIADTATKAVIACPDESTAQALRETQGADEREVAFEVQDFTISSDEVSKEPIYDVIIINSPNAIINHAQVAVGNLTGLLVPNGRLCIAGTIAELQDLRSKLGDEKLKQTLFGTELGLLVVEKAEVAHTNGTNGISEKPLTLIEPPQLTPASQQFRDNICEQLFEHHYSVERFTWGSDVSSLAGKHCISLLELERSWLRDLSAQDFNAIKSLIVSAKDLFWLTGFNDPAASLIDGVARVARNEIPSLSFRTLHADGAAATEDSVDAITRAFTSESGDDEYVLKQNILHTSRIHDDTAINEDIQNLLSNGKTQKPYQEKLKDIEFPVKLSIREPGILSSLCMEADDLASGDLAEDEVEIDVKVTSISHKDATDRTGAGLGGGAAGLVLRTGSKVLNVKTGDKAVIWTGGACRTIYRGRADLCVSLPPNLSFDSGLATIWAVGTAWFALIRLGQVQQRASILLQTLPGQVAKAAVQIARHHGLTILATATRAERSQLIEQGVSPDCIFDADSAVLAKSVKRLTGGAGIDLVLSTATGEASRQAQECIADFGLFIELGEARSPTITKPNVTYTSFELDTIARKRPQIMSSIAKGAFDLIKQGVVEASEDFASLPVTNAHQVLHQLQTGKLHEPVHLLWDADHVVSVVKPKVDGPILSAKGVYLLAGGLGGLGRSLALKLLQLGARKLVFLSRSGATSKSAVSLLKELEGQGAQAKAYKCDIANEKSLTGVIAQCENELGEVRGVFQCAMVLRDVLLANMTHEQWVESTRPKIQGSWNLHKALPELDFFVTLSSFAAVFGNPGQSNYAAGGAFEDALSHHRRSHGQHAVTLDVGIMRDIGVLAETGITESLREWEEPYGIREKEFHSLIELAVSGDQTGTIAPQVLTGLATGGSAVAAGISQPYYLDRKQFSVMARTGMRQQQGQTSSSGGDSVPILTLIGQATSLDEASNHVTEALRIQVAKLLEAPESEIDSSRFLHSFGIDSLSAIRIVSWALKELKSTITVFDVLGSVPMTTLATQIAAKSTALSKDLVPA